MRYVNGSKWQPSPLVLVSSDARLMHRVSLVCAAHSDEKENVTLHRDTRLDFDRHLDTRLPNWHQQTVFATVLALPSGKIGKEVIALWLGGSLVRGTGDVFSDIDFHIAVAPCHLARWEAPSFEQIFGHTSVVGQQFLRFGNDDF